MRKSTVEAVDVTGSEVLVLELEDVGDVVFPFTCSEDVVGTVPKDFITSVSTAGVEAGEEDNCAEASSTEPNIAYPER